ncbi:unnamed protein product [Clonostachys chloroleuca]|uniref:Trichothecene 3-O-acetyltransferase-like N-terminal domain-containing protein n=1 Tax=Clonostachys chloroleuca TaxID=1926264 RepID=A0AA35LQZ3_9HYPO|nr:unnamed protein product [Clonostachys chloroleuca]
MPRIKEYQLHPTGWENDPEREEIKLCTLDYLTTMAYLNHALFFEVKEEEKAKVEIILKEGLERTLSQTRQMNGYVEPNNVGGYSIIKRKDDTVKFAVQYLDSPEDNFPSYSTIAKAHFTTAALGDVKVLCNASHVFGRTPEARAANRPALGSFKATFIPGGLIFVIHHHHFTNGIDGLNSLMLQLAENCYAILNKTKFPSWDPRCMDRTCYGLPLGFERPSSNSSSSTYKHGVRGEAPSLPHAQSRNRPVHSLIFHLPKSKGAELKKAASPNDGTWISSFNALCALTWRVFSRIRQPLYKADPDFKPLFGAGVSIQKYFKDTGMPERLQMNMQFDITSATSHLPQFTLAEIISEVPLSKLASYVRQLTESVSLEMLTDKLEKLSHVPIEDLSISVHSFPLMAFYITDWRPANLSAMDFGFGGPAAHRHLFTEVQRGQSILYPPQRGPGGAGDDEGVELQITFEAELVKQLLEDPEWSKYMEFRGVDIWGSERQKAGRAML